MLARIVETVSGMEFSEYMKKHIFEPVGMSSSSFLSSPEIQERLAKLVGGELEGDPEIRITGIAGIKEARKGDITFLANDKYAPLLQNSKAAACIVTKRVEDPSIPVIRVKNPDLAFATIVEEVAQPPLPHPAGIHPTAVVAEDAEIGKDVCIEAYCVVESGAKIGERSVISPYVYIGHQTTLGKDCFIHPHVVIRERIEVGNRVIIHAGSVVGSDGFGYTTVDGVHHKIPQIGTVVLEDDVEIGANVAIDRARFNQTLIGRGTKIDNLVQIAHNCDVGEDALIVAQSGLSGGTVVGRGAIVMAQAGTTGHLRIGERAFIGARAGLHRDVPDGARVFGSPAVEEHAWHRSVSALKRLPELLRRVRRLERSRDADGGGGSTSGGDSDPD